MLFLMDPEGGRTLDLRVANAALCQLSYEPVCRIKAARYIIVR